MKCRCDHLAVAAPVIMITARLALGAMAVGMGMVNDGEDL